MRDGHDPIATAGGWLSPCRRPRSVRCGPHGGLVAGARELVDGESEAATRRWRRRSRSARPDAGRARSRIVRTGRGRAARHLRLAVLMDRIDCDLTKGRHEHVLGELKVFVREHPFRERLRAQQMLPSTVPIANGRPRCLRRPAAHRGRTRNRAQPAPATDPAAILRHDVSSLETPDGAAAGEKTVRDRQYTCRAFFPTSNISGPRRPFSRLPRPISSPLAAALVARSACVTASAATFRRPSQPPGETRPRVVPNSLVGLDPRTGEPTFVVPVGVDLGRSPSRRPRSGP